MANRYKGNQDVINEYKRALKNYKARVKTLESRGVTVDVKKKLPKLGEHVSPADVRWLESQTREKIAKKSYIETESHKIIKGSKVVQALEEQSKISRREKAEARKEGGTYVDETTGYVFDSKTGALISKGADRPFKDTVISGTDFADMYLYQFRENLGNYTMSNDELTSVKSTYVRRVGQNANEINAYLDEALKEYGKNYVVQQLQRIAASGKTLNQYVLYDKDAFDLYWNDLINALPLDSRYDSDLDYNEDEYYDEGEDYEE